MFANGPEKEEAKERVQGFYNQADVSAVLRKTPNIASEHAVSVK